MYARKFGNKEWILIGKNVVCQVNSNREEENYELKRYLVHTINIEALENLDFFDVKINLFYSESNRDALWVEGASVIRASREFLSEPIFVPNQIRRENILDSYQEKCKEFSIKTGKKFLLKSFLTQTDDKNQVQSLYLTREKL